MKKSILLCLLAFSFSVSAQTIRRVNNNPGVTGVNVYTTIQAAHDAAGDIVYLEPTSVTNPSDYGTLTVTKQINIVGPGYFLDKNAGINPPFDSRTPQISTLNFNTGSTNITMTGVYVNSTTNFKCENITISRCRLSGVNFQATATTPPESGTNGNNIAITKCIIFEQLTAKNGCNNCGYNITVSNNIITTGFSYIAQSFSNSLFNSNTILPSAYGQYGGAFGNFTGCVVSNNIFDLRNNTLYTTPITGNSTGTTYSNNVCVGYNGLPTGNGNINNASSTNFFVTPNDPLNNTVSDNVFQLSATSPALTVAFDGG